MTDHPDPEPDRNKADCADQSLAPAQTGSNARSGMLPAVRRRSLANREIARLLVARRCRFHNPNPTPHPIGMFRGGAAQEQVTKLAKNAPVSLRPTSAGGSVSVSVSVSVSASASCHRSSVIGHRSSVIAHWSLVICHRHQSSVSGHSKSAICCLIPIPRFSQG